MTPDVPPPTQNIVKPDQTQVPFRITPIAKALDRPNVDTGRPLPNFHKGSYNTSSNRNLNGGKEFRQAKAAPKATLFSGTPTEEIDRLSHNNKNTIQWRADLPPLQLNARVVPDTAAPAQPISAITIPAMASSFSAPQPT